MTARSHDCVVIFEKGVDTSPKQTFFNLTEQKRERIIACAVKEFADSGYKQASISRIVQAAEIAKGSFYQYFEDKDDLYIHIVRMIGQKKMDTYSREAGRLKEMNLTQFLRYVFRVQLEEFRQHPELTKVIFDLHKMAGEPIHKEIMEGYEDATNTFFLPMINHEIALGEIDSRVNPAMLNHMLLGYGDYLLGLLRSGQICVPSEKLMDEFVDDLEFILTNGIYTEKGKRCQKCEVRTNAAQSGR